MCGRFTLGATAPSLAAQFNLANVPTWTPRYNIAPTQEVLVVVKPSPQASREARLHRWGLIPPWANDPAIGNRLINARAETVATKPAFRHAFKERRCLVLADGFYEWHKEGTRKQPYHIRLRDGRLFAFAGLWARWESEDALSPIPSGRTGWLEGLRLAQEQKREEKMDPDRESQVKRISRVAPFGMLFGLGSLLAGVFIIILALASQPASVEIEEITFFLCGVLALVGAILMCVRIGIILDPQRRTVTTWWGLLVPFYKNEHPFPQTQYVSLSREEHRPRGGNYVVFPVRLEDAGTHAITVDKPRDYDKARRLAEEIAKFIHCGIRDRSSEIAEVVREAGTFD